jgi:hypothetical protein
VRAPLLCIILLAKKSKTGPALVFLGSGPPPAASKKDL